MYKIDSWRENIYVIFGTWNVFAALLVPMERTLPLRGLEWSFISSQHDKNQSNADSKGRQEDTENLL